MSLQLKTQHGALHSQCIQQEPHLQDISSEKLSVLLLYSEKMFIFLLRSLASFNTALYLPLTLHAALMSGQ